MKRIFIKFVLLIAVLTVLASCGGGGGGGGTGSPNLPGPTEGEGSVSAPKALGTVPISYPGAVGEYAESYYSFHTGSSSIMYTISLTGMQTDLSWHLFSNSTFVTALKNCDNNTSNLDETCTTLVALNPNTDYYLLVDNYWNIAPTAYHITISVTPVPAAPVFSVTAGHLQNIITWAPVTDATKYNVYASTSPSVNKTSYTNKFTYATSPYIHVGVSAATTYYYVLTTENINGESVESAVKSATPLTALTSISSNFDDGTLQGWTASGTWAITNSTSQSGTHSVTDSPAGNYDIYANMSLTSPVLDLVSSATPTLSFYHKFDTETSDNGYVDISTDGGSTWTSQVLAYAGNQAAFTQVNFSLSAYKSNKVVVRFRFHSDFINTVPHDGWYIDDIVIQ